MKNIVDFENLLIDAVNEEKQKIGGRFAVMLSGGLDSGLIAAISRPDLALICNAPFGEKYDEFRYAEKTAKHLKIKYEVVEARREEFVEGLKKGVLAIGKVIPHFSIYPLYLLFKKAKEIGIKHIIRGDGGDELLGGYSRNLLIKLIVDLYDLPELKNYGPLINLLIDSPLEAYCKISNPRREVKELKPYWDEKKDAITNMCLIDLNLQMPPQIDMIEKIAKSFDIKVHFPFLNKKIVDFCLTLPSDYKIMGRTTKWIERQVAMKYLPKEIIERKEKMGGPLVPVNMWMGWMEKGEFDKTEYLKYQEDILNGRK